MKLIVGLGNPGSKYEDTRHNIGFIVVDRLAESYSVDVNKSKFDAIFGKGRIEGSEVVIAKPQAYMNRSGPPVQSLANFFRISCEDMVVVHDDIDLAYGRIQIKEKGGDGGHKGIRSMKETFGGKDFVRVRVGVGRSQFGSDVVNHVLGSFDPQESKHLDKIVETAIKAVVTILCKGTKEGMNRFNRFKTII